jgi:F-type H+-transporting ATPase subunit delta
VSAAPLDARAIERLVESFRRISGKDVILREESDPKLIGGIVVELEGKIYDGSVQTQLEKMTQRIERGY